MRNFNNLNKSLVRLTLSLAVIFALSDSSFAQVKLRHALDYDGDQKADASIFRGTDSTWYLLKSNGSVATGTAFGASNTDTIAPGDYDGDGKTDIIAIRKASETLSWYILKSSDGGLLTANFGAAETDLPTQNDYDGDGRTDISV